MTRKDYELIAQVLKDSSDCMDELSMAALIDNFATELQNQNPRFNREQFIWAAGSTPLKVKALLA